MCADECNPDDGRRPSDERFCLIVAICTITEDKTPGNARFGALMERPRRNGAGHADSFISIRSYCR